MRNGIDQPIEIYDLEIDSAESHNLAATRPDLVRKAERILLEAHVPDPNWPLNGRSQAHTESSKAAWDIKRERDKTKWVPPHAIHRHP